MVYYKNGSAKCDFDYEKGILKIENGSIRGAVRNYRCEGFTVGGKKIPNEEIKEIIIGENVFCEEDPDCLFSLPNLEKIHNINKLETTEVTDMSYMFFEAMSLEELDLSGWDTRGVIAMEGMFYGNKNLKKINTDNWDVSEIENLESMFAFCEKIKSVDMSKWYSDTDISIDYNDVFYECPNLKEVITNDFIKLVK